METNRLPIHNREAILFNYALPVIKGCTAITAAMGTGDQAALSTNGAMIVAETTFADLATAQAGDGIVIAAQPDVPRNVVVGVHNDSGGGLNLYEGTMTVTVTGTFRGKAQVDAIAIVSSAANKAVANTKYRAWAGSKPFDTITKIEITNAGAATMKACVGVGECLGLPNKPYSDDKEDITKICIDSANVATNFDATNQTVKTGTRADGKSVMINYFINTSEIRKRLFNK